MTIFVQDSFTDTNGTLLSSHTGETGATWTKHSGSGTAVAEINSNEVRSVAGGGSADAVYYTSGVPAGAEYDIDANFIRKASGTADASILGRVVTGSSTYYLAQYSSVTNAWTLFKRVSGTFTSLGSYVQGLGTGTYAFSLSIRDSAKKLYVAGVERISSSDNAITGSGLVGIRFVGDRQGATLDSLVATDLSSGSSVLPNIIESKLLKTPLLGGLVR